MSPNLAMVPETDKPDRLSQFNAVKQAEEKANAVIVTDEHSLELALVFQTEIRALYDLLEDMRDGEVRPLNDQVRSINDDYRPYTTLCKAIDQRLDQQVKAYRMEQKRLREEAQRKAIEDARRKKAEEEAKAAELRRQAEDAKRKEQEAEAERQRLAELEARVRHEDDEDALLALAQRKAAIEEALSPVTETKERLQADLTAIQQQKALARANGDDDALLMVEAREKRVKEQLAQLSTELTVVDLEAQAQQAELAAATVAPEVIQQVDKTVTLGTGKKMTFTTKKVPVCLPGGLPLDGTYYRDDSRLKALPDDLFVLDVKRLKNRVKDGQVFAGVEVVEEETSRRR